MKIELEIDEKDLKEMISGLNNAIIAYHDFVRSPIFLQTEIPEKFAFLEGKTMDTLTEKIDNRLELLHNVYNQFLKYEK